MKSLVFEEKYGVKIKELQAIDEINQIIETKEKIDIKYNKDPKSIMIKGGNVFRYSHINPDDLMKKTFRIDEAK